MARLPSYPKDPDAVLDYPVDWSDWLADGETLASAAFAVPTGLTKDSETNTTTAAVVWLSGGTAGEQYRVTCHVTTSDGRADDRSFLVQVTER